MPLSDGWREQSRLLSIKALRAATLGALPILSTWSILSQVAVSRQAKYLLEIAYLLEVVLACAEDSKTCLALEMRALWLRMAAAPS
jgi:hypothetical protein